MRDFKVYQASRYLTKLVTDASDVRKEYEEISGSLVQFDTPISAPLESLIVDIKPVQSGTGDPSPDNVRPITGWTGANIYHSGEDTDNPTVYTVSWQDEAGTVYGGTLDLVSGVLTADTVCITYDGSGDEGWIKRAYGSAGNYSMAVSAPDIAQLNDDLAYVKSNYLPSIKNDETWGNYDLFVSKTSTTIVDPLVVCGIRTITTLPAWEAYLAENLLQIMYPLATPITYQLTPQEINTLIGVNNIWADTGDVSVKYRTH